VDNNPYGLKVYAFLKLAGLEFRHEHVFDASAAPRGQLPYVVDSEATVGDSDTIIAHLIDRYALPIDEGLTQPQRDLGLLLRRTFDDLYWVMSYSRWKDPRFWPQFEAALLARHPNLTTGVLEKAQAYNFQRYHYQGIGRYAPDAAYARGLADLSALARLIPDGGYVHGAKPSGIDCGIYGFVANIYFFDIDTPLKQFVTAHGNLVGHCRTIHAMAMRAGAKESA